MNVNEYTPLTNKTKATSYSTEDDDHQSSWKILKQAIHDIQTRQSGSLSFEQLYRKAYYLVLNNSGKMLYDGVRNEIVKYLRGINDKICTTVDELLLQVLINSWHDHQISMITMRDVLMYLDRCYVVESMQSSIPTVYELGVLLFRDLVVNTQKSRISRLVMSSIEKERYGGVVDQMLLKQVMLLLLHLGINTRGFYESFFEHEFLRISAAGFASQSQELLWSCSAADYLKYTESLLASEVTRVKTYLDLETEPKIRAILLSEMIAKHVRTLIQMDNGGLKYMLTHDLNDDIRRMYKAMTQTDDGIGIMVIVIKDYFLEAGTKIIQSQKEHTNESLNSRNHKVRKLPNYAKVAEIVVEGLMGLLDKYLVLINGPFENNRIISRCVYQAFDEVVNIDPRTPEWISVLIDMKFRRSQKRLTEDELENFLDRIMFLFRFVNEKDVFERFYKQHLGRRLLTGNKGYVHAERQMVQKLKAECGHDFASKLEGMFHDISISSDTNSSFLEYIGGNSIHLPVEINVNVLAASFWPTQMTKQCVLPSSIVQSCSIFEKFFQKRHSGRKITWQTNLGTADLHLSFGRTQKEIICSTFQMTILLLFNDFPTLSADEIVAHTSMNLFDVKKNLHRFVYGKYKILVKVSNDKESDTKRSSNHYSLADINSNDKFTCNSKFRCKLFRIIIGTGINHRESSEVTTETRNKVEEDRKHLIEAAVVRVMKARNEMEHTSLISEVTKMLSSRFLPQPQSIKRRIESLIEREYIARSEAERRIYRYLA